MCVVGTFLCVASNLALASGLEKLNQALMTLTGESEISAELSVSVSDIRDDGEPKLGEIALALSDNTQGLQITYSKAVLDLLHQEKQAKAEHKTGEPPVKQVTTKGMSSINSVQLRNMLTNAQGLRLFLTNHQFASEEKVIYQEQEAILLTFDLTMEKVVSDKKWQKHIDEFDGKYQLWITPEGFPIADKTNIKGKGSYFFFFTGEMEINKQVNYQVVADRLVVVDSSYMSKSRNTFGGFEYHRHKTLNVLSSQNTPQLSLVTE